MWLPVVEAAAKMLGAQSISSADGPGIERAFRDMVRILHRRSTYTPAHLFWSQRAQIPPASDPA